MVEVSDDVLVVISDDESMPDIDVDAILSSTDASLQRLLTVKVTESTTRRRIRSKRPQSSLHVATSTTAVLDSTTINVQSTLDMPSLRSLAGNAPTLQPSQWSQLQAKLKKKTAEEQLKKGESTKTTVAAKKGPKRTTLSTAMKSATKTLRLKTEKQKMEHRLKSTAFHAAKQQALKQGLSKDEANAAGRRAYGKKALELKYPGYDTKNDAD